ncbi:MAG: MFS transporter, partial [Rubrivivax sp.]|nr:MFS transporter [Rubrivivax sp.]
MLTFAMGLRQSLGIFMPDLTKGIGISVSDFTLAIAVQNLLWGVLQPLAGALSVRFGLRPLMLGGSLLYLLGMLMLAGATGITGVVLGAGVFIGASMACTGPALASAAASRPVSAAVRSAVLGAVSAAGSLGAMLAAPIGQALNQAYGWRVGVIGFSILALIMLPAAWVAGKVDQVPLPPSPEKVGDSAGAALGAAIRHVPFVVLTLAFFVCGMQLIFLTTHLPSYLQVCGMDPMLSAQALGVIGGFNVLGSLFFGWAGGRWNKLVLLGGIYVARSLVLLWYFASAPTPAGTLAFAALMGFLWLGVGP